jgi:hypothetical protein
VILEILKAIDWLIDPARHWFTASLVGFVVFSLTWIISCAPFWALRLGLHRKVSSDVAYFILLCSLLAMLSAVVLSHYVLDFGWVLWSMPWDPGLDLK